MNASYWYNFLQLPKEKLITHVSSFNITSLQPQGIHAVKYDVPKPDLGEIIDVTMVMPRMSFWFFCVNIIIVVLCGQIVVDIASQFEAFCNEYKQC